MDQLTKKIEREKRPMLNLMCYRHPVENATTNCERCHEPICEVCKNRFTLGSTRKVGNTSSIQTRKIWLCPTCFADEKHGGKLQGYIAIVILIGLFAILSVPMLYMLMH